MQWLIWSCGCSARRKSLYCEVEELKEKFRQLPNALQKQIFVRSVIGMIALLLFVVILIYTKEFAFCLPCLILTAYMIVNSALLFYNCIRGRYVVLKGECVEVEKTMLRKRVKAISITVEDKLLTILVRHKLKAPAISDTITVYLPETATVYEKDGGYSIYDYYAFELNRKV